MNLLSDSWIPVRKGAEFKQITYKELLCSDQPDLQVALPRDDLELACIQMLAAMTQVIFMPEDKKVLRARIKTSLSEKEYDAGVGKYKEWFDLNHPKWPFMQAKNVIGKMTSMQKLMIGMPEESSTSPNAHCFFNEPTEIKFVCAGVTAIALFNQASNSPSFGGGFKGSLRGAAPVSTMVMGKYLRDTIWQNVLSEDKVRSFLPWYDETKDKDEPVWVKPIRSGNILPHTIGLLRGLFWQPAHIEMVKGENSNICDVIGGAQQAGYVGFKKEKFVYELKGVWPHPYSPRQFDQEGGIKYIAFWGADPAWTQMTQYLFESRNNQNEGYSPAAIVSSHADSEIFLLIGGYKASKAAIEYRRHELYSLPAGWNEELKNQITEVIDIAIGARNALWSAIKNYVDSIKDKRTKKVKVKGFGVKLQKNAQAQYYHLSETFIRNIICNSSNVDLKVFSQTKNIFLEEIFCICFDIFDRVTQPFVHKPELIGTIALARVKLERMIGELKRTHTVIQGGGLPCKLP
jgi:CRISPR system Cascade subunit CasA